MSGFWDFVPTAESSGLLKSPTRIEAFGERMVKYFLLLCLLGYRGDIQINNWLLNSVIIGNLML